MVQYCEQCGTEIKDDSTFNFCEKCGHPVVRTISAKIISAASEKKVQSPQEVQVAVKPSKNMLYMVIGIVVILVIFGALTFSTVLAGSSIAVKNPSTVSTSVSNPQAITQAAAVTITPAKGTSAIPYISGLWTGQLFQGGGAMDISMDISQSVNQIQGRFKIMDKNNHLNYGIFSVSGHIEGNELYLNYDGLIEKQGNVNWCTDLRMLYNLPNSNPQMLSGKWTSNCGGSGNIVLTKKV